MFIKLTKTPIKINKSLIFWFTLMISFFVEAQQKQYQSATIGFYNVENLFDTDESCGYIDGNKAIEDQLYHISIPLRDTAKYEHVPFKSRYTFRNLERKKVLRRLILTDEFTPGGDKRFTEERYQQKLQNISKVISNLGKDVTKTAPVIVGLVEVENRKVVEDLTQTNLLKPYNYGVVHYNSFDKRGIDCALIYQKERFLPTYTNRYVLEVYNVDGNRDYTRDILRVSGLLDGEPIHVLINHWPSRRGGEAASNPKRVAAGKLLRSIIDNIQAEEPNAKIISMGDFNDDPTNESMRDALGAVLKETSLRENGLFNAMGPMFKKGFGTLAFRDGWNLFDQIILSEPLVNQKKKKDYSNYKVFKTEIFSPDYLLTPEGQYKGYPYRSYSWDTFNADGYSDHFPVYTILLREIGR